MLMAASPPTSVTQREGLSLTVDDDGCLTAVAIADRIVAELGEAPPKPIEVTVQAREPGAFVVTLVAGAARAERSIRFDEESCATRIETVALVLALALEFFVALEAEPPPPAPIDPPIPTPPRTPEPARVDVVPPRRDRGPGWGVGVGGLVHSGVVVHPSAGALLRVEHAWRRVGARMTALWSYAGGVAIGNGRVRIHEVAAVPEACARFFVARAALSLCGGMRLGAIVSQGRDFARPRTESTPWIAPTLGAEVAAPLGDRVALAFGGQIAAPVLRPRFVAGDRTRTAAPVLGGATVTVVVWLSKR